RPTKRRTLSARKIRTLLITRSVIILSRIRASQEENHTTFRSKSSNDGSERFLCLPGGLWAKKQSRKKALNTETTQWEKACPPSGSARKHMPPCMSRQNLGNST